MLLDYRKDIDGLRAIAVMLVVLFHAGFAIPGGFIGVDIFFVISGFLIASLIQKQILRGKFTFKGFYLHRMRRILPVLLFVMFMTFLFNWFVLMPGQFNMFARSSFFALLSLSNMFFWRNTGGYFDVSTEQIQVLHTWSLSVEEQFYIGVPIFLIILFKYFYNTKWFNYILGFVLLSSFAVSQYLAVEYAKLAYYGLPARFFELFIGVWLALNYEKLPVSKNKLVNNILALIGLLLILLPAFLITKQSVFPGFNALFVCLGSAILIYLGKCEDKTFFTKLLSLKPMVFIGLISYSLYLWHWPVFATFKIIGLEFSSFEMLGVVLALVILSACSWKFIEQPFRHKFKFGFTVTFIILFVLPVIFAFILKKESFDNFEFDKMRLQHANEAVQSYIYKHPARNDFCYGIKQITTRNRDHCVIGDKSQIQPKVFFYGDSHAQSMVGFVDLMLSDAQLQSQIAFWGGGMYLKDVDLDRVAKKLVRQKKSDIKNYLDYVSQEIQSGKYDYVITTGYYTSQFGRHKFDEISKKFLDTLEMIYASGAQLIILNDTPYVGELAKQSLHFELMNISKNFAISKQEVNEYKKVETKMWKLVKEKFPQTIFVDLKDIMLVDGKYPLKEGNILFYKDNNHLSDSGSVYLGKKYLEKYGNPLKKVLNY